MANIKISELDELVNVANDDYLPIVDTNEGETKKLNFETITKTILNTAFPIGKVEVFFDDADHSNYLGFTWERTSIGKVPVGIDSEDADFNAIGKTGGEKKHTLTANEIPDLPVKFSNMNAEVLTKDGTINTNLASGYSRGVGKWDEGTDGTLYADGGNQPHNNLQPYEVMAFWKRIN